VANDAEQTVSPQAASVAELGAVLLTEQSLDQLLDLVVALARRSVDGADGVSVSIMQHGSLRTSNHTDEVVNELDQVQYQHREGPCVEAVTLHHPVRISLEQEPDRYGTFNDAARQRFITAVMSLPLSAGEGAMGALNFYSATRDTFDDADHDVAVLFAAQASILLANAIAYAASKTETLTLHDALATREMIGAAKGIIMAREGCTPEQAFDRLREASQHANRKLHLVAQELVESVQRHDPPR
jgi:GAF domain-containing protein